MAVRSRRARLDRRGRRAFSVALGLVAFVGLMTGCSIDVEGGGSDEGATTREDEVGDRWDLRDGHDIDRVGWPDDLTGNTLVVETSTLVVELPGGAVIDVGDLDGGPASITVGRSTVPGIDDRLVRIMRIESPRGTVDEIGELAERLAARYGLDGSDFGPWMRRNPTFGGPDGEASTGSEDLVAGGPSLAVETRVRAGDEAVVAFTVVWPFDRSEFPASAEPDPLGAD